MTASGCLDDKTVVAFVAGEMPAARRSSVAAHLDSCSACANLTILAAADLAHRSRPPGEEGAPFIGALLPGSRVDRYQILSAVGRGGMGEVYAAYHPDLDRRIALKVVAAAGADSAERRARLLREARAIARLSHPNVVTVYDAGTVDDRVYIAMEFVEGATVDAWLRAKPRGWREILDVFIAAGRGLAAAHAAGVIHRDFKPQNVMVGRDGSVRVMDFGLARLAEEPADARFQDDDEVPEQLAPPSTVTTTGALIGTIAYMSPEQFRRQPLDARADQFSFCVALYEALYGRRPELDHLYVTADSTQTSDQTSANIRAGNAPAWLRAVVARGLTTTREQRFPSMDALLAALRSGQNRGRRRTVALAVGTVAALLALAGWRLTTNPTISCAAPKDRLAAIWARDNESNSRRELVHRALARRGTNGENAWRAVAEALDDYISQWSTMYVETCEATHVRGEQSAEVLDLRMTCLQENMDGVRALTDVLARADDNTSLSQAVSAARDLPRLNRCTDVASLRAAVPLPRDEKTVHQVESLRRSFREGMALDAVGNYRAAKEKAQQILPDAEATGYRPLIAEVRFLIGITAVDAPVEAEAILKKAFYGAEASRDDTTAAKTALAVAYVTGYLLGRFDESEHWSDLAEAIIDRSPSPQPRLRGWLLHGRAVALNRKRDFVSARPLLEQALSLKQADVGKDDPDVAITMTALSWSLNELGQSDEGLRLADRAIGILASLDQDGIELAYARQNRADALIKLGRFREAEDSYSAVRRSFAAQVEPSNPLAAYPLQGLGEAKLGEGDPRAAIGYLEQALRLRLGVDPDPLTVADTQFALARALVAAGRERTRALSLAAAARTAYATRHVLRRQAEVDAWLADHR